MIGPILLAVSWILLRIQKQSLDALGFNAPAVRVRQLAAGFAAAAMVVVVQQLGLAAATHATWLRNPEFNLAQVWQHTRWNVNSVLFEEFIFRGWLLWQAIRLFGERRAVLLSASAFGAYHWFTMTGFSNPVAMAFIFLFTGAFGLMLALAFARTKSMALPIGLHLGWNCISYTVFSTGPLGRALFVPSTGVQRLQAEGWMALLLDVVLPLVFITVTSRWLMRGSPSTGRTAAVAETDASTR